MAAISVAVLTARANGLQKTAEALQLAFHQPGMQDLVIDAAANLREARRWFADSRLEGSHDCRVWVDAILNVTARRLTALEEELRRHGPDAAEPTTRLNSLGK